MNQDKLDQLKLFIRLLPSENHWEFDRDNLQITDPRGSVFSLHSDEDVGQVTLTLYMDVITVLLNDLSEMVETINSLNHSEAALHKELKHFKGRGKGVYNRALEDVESIIQLTPIHSRSAMEAVNSIMEKLQALYDAKVVPPRGALTKS